MALSLRLSNFWFRYCARNSNRGNYVELSREGLGLGLGRNGIGLKREEAVIVGAGARHLIWHSRRKSPVVVCAPFPKR